MKRLLFALVFGSFFQVAYSQFCGTPQDGLLQRVDLHKKELLPLQRGIVKYVPVTFHLVAAANGSGRVTEENVLRQLASVNAAYADQEMIFYIDRFNYFDNDAVYQTPASNAARVQMRIREDNNSLNLFITNTADSGMSPGFVLAYYDPQDDWVVSRRNEINGASSTVAHEFGHFFSLPHPHSGWDCVPYTTDDYTNPVNVTMTLPCEGGGGSSLIELHNRTNCNTAGDRICDTPEDYNLGLFHVNGCIENNSIRDINNEIISPMVNNFMGYYRDCPTYAFTEMQKTLMNTDFFSFPRQYIRTGKVPNLEPITHEVAYVYPINGESTNGNTNVVLDWEDTPGADSYLIIYDRFPSFTNNPQKTIVTESELTIPELTDNATYYWKVWPFNESQTYAEYSETQNFKVGMNTAVNDIRQVTDYLVYPNPAKNGEQVLLSLATTESFNATVFLTNASGATVKVQQLDIPVGQSIQTINVDNLPAGLYIIQLKSENGTLIERLTIQE